MKGNPEKKALPKPKPQKKEGLGEEEQKENPEKKPVIKKNPFG